jgi:hypothetical protein
MIHLPILAGIGIGKIALGAYIIAWSTSNLAKLRRLVHALESEDYEQARQVCMSILQSVFAVFVLGDFGERLDSFVKGDRSSANVCALSAVENSLISGAR